VDVKPLYTGDDWSSVGDPSGFSGTPPFTRASEVLGTSRGGWDIRQDRAEPTVEGLNRAILEDLGGGVTSVVIRLDAAGRNGLDGDDPAGSRLVGVDGAMLYSPADFQDAFAGVYLNMIGVGLECGGAFLAGAAQLAALWERAGVKPESARGAFNADPLAVLARDGQIPGTLAELMKQLADLAAWTDARYEGVRSVRVGTACYHHAGATATQDLGYSMASGIEYLRAMEGAGLSIDRAARQMVFSFAVGCNFFLATAKLRAARRLWARVVQACGANDAGACGMTMHVRPSKRVLTSRDPWVNMLRNTACALAGALGGAQSVGTTPFDIALGGRSELGRRVARNTHLILREECGLHRICDPAGGSWYLESLTEELATKAWSVLQDVESRGGMSACLMNGYIGGQIAAVNARRERNLATRREAIIGVSDFPNLGEEAPSSPAPDPYGLRRSCAERLRAWRRGVDRAGVDRALAAIGTSKKAGGLAAGAFAAAKAGATIGRLHAALCTVTSTTLPAPISVSPFAEPFEHLRDVSDQYLAQCGHRPRVFLASMGALAQHGARTEFARGFFESGGFEVIAAEGYRDIAAAAEAFAQSQCGIAVICSSDDYYRQSAAELAPALHRAGARTVVLAGNPGAGEAAYRAAGIDRFIYVKCDVVATLRELLTGEGLHP
jgi:methylmalonyl-CoA mutase